MFLRKLYQRIVLPLCFVLLLAACGEATPITTPIKMVMFGDSLTAGFRLPADASVPARLQTMFLEDGHTGVRVVNMGISGDTTENGLSRLNLLLDAQPDVVVLELGANDILQQVPVDVTREHLEIMITTLQEQGITIVLCGVEVPGAVPGAKYAPSEYTDMFDELAKDYGLLYYPNFLSGVQGKSGMNQTDGLHPSPKGTQTIAKKLYPTVLKAARMAATPSKFR